MVNIEEKGNVLIILVVFLVLVVAGSLYYFSSQKSKQTVLSQPPADYTYQTSPTSKTSLNPNTGSLYTDIKIRLKEVLK